MITTRGNAAAVRAAGPRASGRVQRPSTLTRGLADSLGHANLSNLYANYLSLCSPSFVDSQLLAAIAAANDLEVSWRTSPQMSQGAGRWPGSES